MKKNGFIISTTLYGIFGIMMITIFYILYILSTNRVTLNSSIEVVKKEIENYKYEKIYVNFLGTNAELDKLSNTDINNLQNELKNNNILMDWDKSIATEENTTELDRNIEEHSIVQDLNLPFSEIHACNKTNLQSSQTKTLNFLGVTKDGYALFVYVDRWSNTSANIKYYFINKKGESKSIEITDQKISDNYIINDVLTKVYQDESSLKLCLQITAHRDGTNTLREVTQSKIIEIANDYQSSSSSGFSNSACTSRSQYSSMLPEYKEDSNFTVPEFDSYTVYSNSSESYIKRKYDSCKDADICLNSIQDYSDTGFTTVPSNFNEGQIASYKDYVFTHQFSKIKRYGIIVNNFKADRYGVPTQCYINSYIVWFIPDSENQSQTYTKRTFNLTNTNKDPNTKYNKEYYVLITDSNKDGFGVSHLEFSDNLNTTINSGNGNVKNLIFTNDRYYIPISKNATFYVGTNYNTNVISRLKTNITNDFQNK